MSPSQVIGTPQSELNIQIGGTLPQPEPNIQIGGTLPQPKSNIQIGGTLPQPEPNIQIGGVPPSQWDVQPGELPPIPTMPNNKGYLIIFS